MASGFDSFSTPTLELKLVRSSQTIAALRTIGDDRFEFSPADWLERRSGDGYFHLGDLNIHLRIVGTDRWQSVSTATKRNPVTPLDPKSISAVGDNAHSHSPSPASQAVLAVADLAPTLPADLPLRILRYWEVNGGNLGLRFELTNTSDAAVEIGGLGIPMVFNNILHERSLEEAHATNVFFDPYIGLDAGYLQVTRLNGHGPALVVVPQDGSAFEAYNPLLADSTQRSISFEGFYEWMVHSYAYADGSDDSEWKGAQPWNVPTSFTLAPGSSRSYGVRFLVADEIRDIEKTLIANERPVAVGVPGYVVPMDLDARLFLNSPSRIESIRVDPIASMSVTIDTSYRNPSEEAVSGKRSGVRRTEWTALQIKGQRWGRSRVTIEYADGTKQSIHYKVIKAQNDVLADVGKFLTNEQWFEQPDDAFGRSPSVISYDYYNKRQVTQDNRAWIAGLGDEGGSGSWLTAMMKQLLQPDVDEIRKLERFVDEVLWGGLQYSEGGLKYGVRKSLFYYEPEKMPAGTYSDTLDFSVWSSWNKEHAMTVGRSFNYPHVAAAYWVLYRLARNTQGLVSNHSWDWYLNQAYETTEAMVKYASEYAQFGQMEGTIFLMILLDLRREGKDAEATTLESTMRKRADVWRALGIQRQRAALLGFLVRWPSEVLATGATAPSLWIGH